MDVLYTLVSVASLAMLAGGVALQVRTYARRRAVRPRLIVLGQAIAFSSMALFSIALARPPGLLEWALLLVVGIVGGLKYGGLVRIERVGAAVVMSYTLPWLIAWGALLLLSQGVAILTGRLPWVVYSLAILTMALNLGMNGNVVARAKRLRLGAFAATALLAPVLAGLLALAPAGASPTRAGGASCPVDTLPSVLRPLLPPGGIVAADGDVPTVSFWLADDRVHVSYSTQPAGGGVDVLYDAVAIEIFASAAEAAASHGAWLDELAEHPMESWEPVEAGGRGLRRFEEKLNPTGGWYSYYGLAGAAWVEVLRTFEAEDPDVQRANNADGFFAAVLASAAAIDPAAVFGVAAVGECEGDGGLAGPVGPEPTAGDVSSGSDGSSGPGGPSGGAAGLPGQLADVPITPAELAGASLLANGLLLLGSIGQFILAGGSLSGGLPFRGGPTSGGSPVGPGPGGSPVPGGPPVNGTPTGDGRFWYRAPWEEGGPVPTDPADVAAIEARLRQGLVWSKTDGWVTPEQGAAYEATRARQRAIERAESDAAAAADHARIQAARDAQEAARRGIANADRAIDIIDEMAAAEREHAADMATLGRIEAVGAVVTAADYAGEAAAFGLGVVGGPLGIAVRAGYRTLKGAAGGLGSAIADDASWGETNRRVYLGTVRGAAVAATELAVDGAVRWAFGLPPMFPAKPPAPVIPPALLAPKAAVQQAVGEAARLVETKGIAAAAKAVDPARVLRLFEKGGMATLGKLEEAGAISAAEAQVIRRVLTNEVNASVAEGTRAAARDFAAKTGVRLNEVLVGDSGSSAAGRVGSVVTDADRTVLGVFQPDDVAAYASRHGVSEAEAVARLNRELTEHVSTSVAESLPKGLTPKDVGFQGYSGFGRNAGPADSFAEGFTRTRQAVQGDTLVVRPDGTTYRAGRDAILDAEALGARTHGGPPPPAQPAVPWGELEQLGGKQVESLVAHADPKTVAKAMDRVAYLAGRSGIPVDQTVSAAAKAIRAEPQQIPAILERYGLTAEEFHRRSLAAAGRFQEQLTDVGRDVAR